MNILRSLALNARYAMFRRKRAQRMHQLAQQNRAPLSILFYHRVADRCPNDWTISNAKFVQHIEYCRQHFEIISLAEAQSRLASRYSPRPAVAITFDDGYAENMEFAIPWLIENEIPVTYFVTTENVRTGRSFLHDEEAGQRLAINTVSEIRAAADSGVEIGVHSATHADFNTITTDSQLDAEIVDARMDLEMMIGRRIDYLAVPYGMPPQLRPAVMNKAKESGIRGICSAYGAYNMVGNDPFHLRRIHGDPDFSRLRNWLSFDERKLRNEPNMLTEDNPFFDDSPSDFSEDLQSDRPIGSANYGSVLHSDDTSIPDSLTPHALNLAP